MPELDGIEMVKELRKRQKDVRVIFVTGWFQEKDIATRLNKELRENPRYRLLQKPFKIETVWEMTEKYLSENGL
jgi:CheY-like chemotaxis protein